MPSIKKREHQISCPIFNAKERSVIQIFKKIDEVKSIDEKAKNAKILLQKTESLLSCPYYERKNLDCKYCKKLFILRKKTAELLITQA
ncbi:MAG: hypothetical protein H3Z53_12010 [archaeon]|nr:hypothetical protein [archaeon]MCP8315072.1 hypothetical protein [archaeon]MCP8317922.1 hypothetical protein [archaeon]MCP8320423.1 hypothetical protein [archaeon]